MNGNVRSVSTVGIHKIPLQAAHNVGEKITRKTKTWMKIPWSGEETFKHLTFKGCGNSRFTKEAYHEGCVVTWVEEECWH